VQLDWKSREVQSPPKKTAGSIHPLGEPAGFGPVYGHLAPGRHVLRSEVTCGEVEEARSTSSHLDTNPRASMHWQSGRAQTKPTTCFALTCYLSRSSPVNDAGQFLR
jgi:hypothetical protein